MAQVAPGLSWTCNSASAGVCPSIRTRCVPFVLFLTNELKRISTGGMLIVEEKKNINPPPPPPPLRRDKQIRLSKLERVPQTRTVITKELLKIAGADFDISLHKD